MSVKPVSMKEMLRDLPDEKIGKFMVKLKINYYYVLQGPNLFIACNLGLKIIQIQT